MDNFFKRAWDVACQIPVGKVTSYGAIARYLGATRSARMVGWAMNNSHASKVNVPAHRVVNRKGLLTGKNHFQGQQVMKELLESEGIIVKGDQIVNFDKVFWDPVKELEIK